MSSTEEHLNQIGAAVRLFDGTRECLEALESLSALRSTIAEMERNQYDSLRQRWEEAAKARDIAEDRQNSLGEENRLLRRQIAEMERKANAGSRSDADLEALAQEIRETCRLCNPVEAHRRVFAALKSVAGSPTGEDSSQVQPGSPAVPLAPPSEAANRESDALRNLVRVIELDDVPGYVYDALEAECVGCESKAPKIGGVIHTEDCFQGALEQARAALPNPQSPGDDADAGNGLSGVEADALLQTETQLAMTESALNNLSIRSGERIASLEKALREIRQDVVAAFSCNHAPDDGSDDPCDGEDCRLCWTIRLCDAALSSTETTPQHGSPSAPPCSDGAKANRESE